MNDPISKWSVWKYPDGECSLNVCDDGDLLISLTADQYKDALEKIARLHNAAVATSSQSDDTNRPFVCAEHTPPTWRKTMKPREGHNNEASYHVHCGAKFIAAVRGEDNASALVDEHNATVIGLLEALRAMVKHEYACGPLEQARVAIAKAEGK